jgi:hypothetical protein
MRGHLLRSRIEKVLNVPQRVRLRFFLACGLASDPASFASFPVPVTRCPEIL